MTDKEKERLKKALDNEILFNTAEKEKIMNNMEL